MKTIAKIIAVLAISFSATSAAHAQAYFGAIAYSPQTGAMGWAYDHRSRGSAENTALSGCYEHASDCRVAIWFRNACGALAVGRNGGWGTGWAANQSRAESQAINSCSQHTGGCRVKRWVCTAR